MAHVFRIPSELTENLYSTSLVLLRVLPSAAHLFELPKAEQRLCDWRAGFGSTAIALVSNFVEHQKSQFDTDQKCQDYAEKMLDHLAFSFAQVEVCMNQLT